MKFSRFDFTCEWQQNSYIPPFPGSMLRGALGYSLKALVCTIKQNSCEDCLLGKQCLYSRIYENKKVKDRFINQSELPHPYVIEWNQDCAGDYQKGDSFEFSLVLFGEYIDSLPYFVYAVDNMGKRGLGKKGVSGKRSTMELIRVSHESVTIYQKESKTLPERIPYRTLSCTETPDKLGKIVNRLRIKLVTPLRLKEGGRFAREIDFQIFMRAITRRLEGVWKCYGDSPLVLDKDQIMPLARTIETAEINLRWQVQKRYSNRQATTMNMDGIVGDIVFKGNLNSLLPLITAAEPLHIGKATSFGLGKYVIVEA